MPKHLNLTNQKFNHLTALRESHAKGGRRYWLFSCDCGKEKIICGSRVSSGQIISCGCARRGNKKHGWRHTPEYRVWQSMKNRCLNKNDKSYQNYGERGIFVCKSWLSSFATFIKDMGARPSSKHAIDRINNDDGYYKENCRWVLQVTNNRNSRQSKVWVIDGTEYPSAAAAAAELGVARQTVRDWCLGRSGKKPVQKKLGCECFKLY